MPGPSSSPATESPNRADLFLSHFDSMNPAKVPELLEEMACRVEDPADLARRLQVAPADRFTNTIASPYLFRNIQITLDSVESLAVAARSDPNRAAQLRSLSFCEHACRTAHGVDDSDMPLQSTTT